MQIFDWNATVTEIATIIAAGGTILSGIAAVFSAMKVGKQAVLMREQNEISVTQNAANLTLQTKLALYKERKEKALEEIKQIYEETKMQKHYIPPPFTL
jgi:hypothetical protein